MREIKWNRELEEYAQTLANPHSYTDLYFAKLAKVIGNVHDNPELLERKP